MYKDLVVVLKIGKNVEEILQEVGVRQGDNMAPVLFLFLMSAFAESLEIVWQQSGIDVATVRSVSERDFEAGTGVIKSHRPKQYLSRSLTAFEILQCLYVDDGAFIFTSRGDMSRGMNLIYQHFARFGLEMHIGRGETASKTECVFFPSPSFFKETAHLQIEEEMMDFNDENDGILTAAERRSHESERARIAREDALYDALEETQPILVADGFVTFTRHFKYLGSYVSYNLRDDYDIETRIAAASASMGALKNFWDNPHVELYSKYLLFCAIPMNLLLW